MTDNSIILQLDNLTKRFGEHALPAVHQVSFQLPQGDILGLLGPSGCGKTTLLRMIAGFERPQTGTIAIAGQVVASAQRWVPPEQRDVGMVFQDYALFPHLTVARNVAFGLRHQRRSRRPPTAKMRQLVQAAIALVGLSGLEDRYPHQLSGGQQQRVALARALAPQPALILLDEPLSNLDVQVRLRLRQEVRDILKRTGTSAVFVTHDQEEAMSISDWLAVMRAGVIEQLDRPETVYQEPASRFVAEFVTQANLLPAEFNGTAWETEVGAFPAPAKASPTATKLMIRQEDLQLEPDEAGVVLVRDRQFLGREHRYCLLCPSGRELHARQADPQPLPVGTRVRLSVADAAMRTFPEN